MNELSLFTGAGGGLLASRLLGFKHVGYCDFDKNCQKTLRARIADGSIEDAPLFEDVSSLDPSDIPDRIDLVSGGFPCQPFSQAGKRRGADDPRNQWPNTLRILVESGASLGFFENVPGLASRSTDFYIREVLGSLAESGFDAEWTCLGADSVGAPHQRKRLWILAHRHGSHERVRRAAVGTAADPATWQPQIHVPAGCREVPGEGADVPDAPALGLQGAEQEPLACLGAQPASQLALSESKMFGRKRSGMPWHGGPQPDDRGLWWDRDPADVWNAALDGSQGGLFDAQGRCLQRTVEAPSPERHRLDEAAQSRLGGLVDGLARWVGLDVATEAGTLDRVAPAFPLRTVRVRQLGNGQVPLTAAVAFLLLYNRAMRED